MTFRIRSPELKEIQDVGLQVMREARARTADLRFDKLALDGGGMSMKSRREDLTERLNAGKLVELESKLIEMEPKVTKRPKRVSAKKTA